MGNFDLVMCPGLSVLFLYAPAYRAWLFEKFIFELNAFSYSFKITYIALRQVIYPKKMVMPSAKFTNFISWSPICTPLILLSATMKLASTSAALNYNTDESGHPWWTPRIRVKGSDRRPFILILDWMLVYATSIAWMNFSPYPAFCKTDSNLVFAITDIVIWLFKFSVKYIMYFTVFYKSFWQWCLKHLWERTCHENSIWEFFSPTFVTSTRN